MFILTEKSTYIKHYFKSTTTKERICLHEGYKGGILEVAEKFSTRAVLLVENLDLIPTWCSKLSLNTTLEVTMPLFSTPWALHTLGAQIHLEAKYPYFSYKIKWKKIKNKKTENVHTHQVQNVKENLYIVN